MQKDHKVPSGPKFRPLEERAIYDENGILARSVDHGLDWPVPFDIENLRDVAPVTARAEWIEEELSNGVQVSRLLIIAVGREPTLPVSHRRRAVKAVY